ncbi:DUF2207 domain-containing protein [Persephonella atlantica]|uniref:DUF2207 domain-containing protein n=1 Tax=Persephonella atlantica TaxID=2699429 RepID=A0ABS1GI74_9AQUI|nr:DUF2207 domain-containing protein [Persephonella atlantica]MBK3332550.1 DUF2207 domain-containing protein [Persephonella atlantica]
MEELKKFKLLLFLSVIAGITGIYLSFFYDLRLLFHDLTAQYSAVIEIGETVGLEEQYIFDVKKSGKYRMLYRYWKAPLSYQNSLNNPHIKVADVITDSPYYIKDYSGNVYGNFPPSLKGFIVQKAYRNEVGVISDRYFTAGKYSLKINYLLFPPVNTDGEFNQINIKLADRHIPYTDISISIKDSAGIILKVFPHLPNYSVKKTAEGWLIKGKAKENGLVEIEMLTAKYEFNGYKQKVSNLLQKTLRANSGIVFSNLLIYGFLTVVVSFPVFIFALYSRYGREKSFTVPHFLSFIPEKSRKPYIVNLVFNGDVLEADENAFYSTLLDMHKKGIIKIEPFPSDLQIKIVRYYSEDPYEKRILQFLKKHTVDPEGMVFSSAVLESKIDRYTSQKDITALKIIKNDMDYLMKHKDITISSAFIEDTGRKIFRFTVYPVALICSIFSAVYLVAGLENSFTDTDLYPAFILSTTFVLQILPFVFSHTQLLGRWKENFYKEKLQWNSFRRFLSDLAMIKKYAPEDIVVWEEWLVYGTALGVAKKVEKVMKSLNVSIPEVNISRNTRIRFHRSYRHLTISVGKLQASQKAVSGGGFGAGGGFGGGGAGGR